MDNTDVPQQHLDDARAAERGSVRNAPTERVPRPQARFAGRFAGLPAVALAAEGLALSRPAEPVPYLISARLEHPSAGGEILVALAGYEDDVLSAYASEVAELPSVTAAAAV